MTGDEWDRAWTSLRDWLSKRYLVKFSVGLQRHCWVEDYAQPERTLTITIGVSEVLSCNFLRFVQGWLREYGRQWRVAVPVDNTDQNLILVYPEAIRINSQAEADLEAFVRSARPRLERTIEQGRRFYGLKKKPYPPLPDGA
jgi:hypothetical protein